MSPPEPIECQEAKVSGSVHSGIPKGEKRRDLEEHRDLEEERPVDSDAGAATNMVGDLRSWMTPQYFERSHDGWGYKSSNT